MEAIKSWILSLTAGAALCALVSALAPRGKSAAGLRLCCALVTAILLLGPLRGFDLSAYAATAAALRLEGKEISDAASREAETYLLGVIAQDCGAYILDKAERLGIRDFHAEVTVRGGEKLAAPTPWAVTLYGAADEGQKRELGRLIEGELGIPAERQYWSEDDEN